MEIAPVTEALEREQSENDRHGNVFTVERFFCTQQEPTERMEEENEAFCGRLESLDEMQSASCT